MEIELEEYELPKGKMMHDVTAYTKVGLFRVNDGVATFIVSVVKVGDPPFSMPMPLELVTSHIRHKSAKETESDIAAKIVKRLEDISAKFDTITETKEIESIPQIYHEEKIDGSTLLKAIALAQNPDLAAKLLNNE
ncbi:hypothetical protein [uncultured Dysgonomonas sp.]|uniref:Uncharacterized protein n=1 Tax=uncultured Dysgonomonas sp. TaxID=206096 RepID=A0A212IXR1_9BACT|nr:hypothetical protein [uncultured Dysgonomonas sp.]SBV91996.1 hypothetical protein KL86DYS1_10490 [uncultured Dysgonomonas sp.]